MVGEWGEEDWWGERRSCWGGVGVGEGDKKRSWEWDFVDSIWLGEDVGCI